MRKVRLNFGERMREWKRARKAYADKVKEKVKEAMDIEQSYPKLAPQLEGRSMVTSPTETTEMKTGEVGPISKPSNVIEKAINHLREQANKL